MKRVELHVEHSLKGQFVGRYLLRAEEGLATLGSSRGASVRLLGDGVSGLHASLEWEGTDWILTDLSSEQGTWLKKQPIIREQIKESTSIQIGQHALKLTPVVSKHELFSDAKKASVGTEGEMFHQVVVRRNGMLISSQLGDIASPLTIELSGQTIALLPPTGETWETSEKLGYEIRQRLVRTQSITESPQERIKALWDPELKVPMYLVMAFMFLVGSYIFFMPQDPKSTMVALKPEEQNQYTRMIYDAKKIKKQMAESQKIKKQMLAKAPQAQAPAAASPRVGGSNAGARVVNNIKSSGLKALIGKISARAAKSATLIQSAGVTPDVAGSGVALGIGRSVGSAAPSEIGAGLGDGHKLSGVKTQGKGGGTGSYKGVGGLAVGNVGQASVGVVDEETEVAGGLDKEVIARYIKSQLGQIRYCYERQLSANPELYGKVMVKFTIGGSGSVVSQAVGNSSMNNAMVEGCILRRVAGWQFPAPSGGTQVIVSYPFLFKSTK